MQHVDAEPRTPHDRQQRENPSKYYHDQLCSAKNINIVGSRLTTVKKRPALEARGGGKTLYTIININWVLLFVDCMWVFYFLLERRGWPAWKKSKPSPIWP
jgi:hypothetical protein